MNKNLALLPIIAATALAAPPAQPKVQNTPPLKPPLVGWQTWTSTGARTLPGTPLPSAVTNASVAVVSARGASASATFAVRSSAPIAAAEVSVEGLEGVESDLRLVKCWYQDGNAWFAMRRAPGEQILVPELLLHDDSLVKTDAKSKSNLLRTTPAGEPPQYAPPSGSVVVADDAAKLLPFPMAQGETRELHLRLDIPAGAKPGLFHARIAVKGDGRDLGHLDLDLRIIEYVLPEASGRFLGSKYNDGKKVFVGTSPAPIEGGVYVPYAAVAVLPRERIDRNACSLLSSSGVSPVFPTEFLDTAKALMGGNPTKTLWLADTLTPDNGPAPDAAALAATAKKAIGAGFADTHLFVRPSADRKSFISALDAVDATRAKAWTFADEELFAEAADVIASPMRNGLQAENPGSNPAMMGGPYGFTEYSDTRQQERWHALGTPDYLYIDTDAGVENPGFWRRRLGFECYWLGYDGFILPRLVEDAAPWTDVSSPSMRSRTFLYPTKTGFVSTLAWESVRDAVVDARCLSAVTRLAGEARYLAEKDNKIAIEGRKALSWLEWLRPRTETAETVKLEALAWIDRLDAILGKAVK